MLQHRYFTEDWKVQPNLDLTPQHYLPKIAPKCIFRNDFC